MTADWTVPFDDMLLHRWRTCILCAQPADRNELRYLDTGPHTGYALTLGLCKACVQADADEARRVALVEAQARRQCGR